MIPAKLTLVRKNGKQIVFRSMKEVEKYFNGFQIRRMLKNGILYYND